MSSGGAIGAVLDDLPVAARHARTRSAGISAPAGGREGGFRTFELEQAPPELIDMAVRAARPIGDGFDSVDIKRTDNGFIAMEVNDNPNLEHGIEDQVGKDEIWMLLRWFIERFEQ
jgi:glutathione synthase/RimK-type ligase-like ATP-grasp enzyme